jgi:filamentous hemagglutinin family protein
MALPVVPALAQAVVPTGGAVVAGQAQILVPGAGQLQIDQQSNRAVIDWQSFSVGAGGRVHFNNGTGATLNRVLGGDPSRISGLLSSTGSLWLVNPAGVLVGPDGRVSTGGSFLASTRAIAPAAFMAGGGLLEGTSAAAVVNQGSIEAGGDVVLIGRLVENSGSLKAGGDARLVSAERVLLQEAGADGRVHVEIAADAGTGGAVRNSGRVEAAAAELRAVGGNVYALAADTSGVIRATGVIREGGRILLVGDAGVTVGGTLDASGTAGGSIDVTGAGIAVEGSARVLARGVDGDGGSIRIGGDRQGGPGLAAADTLDVAAGARIDAGSDRGRGGSVILWSEQRTRFNGLVHADGAAGGGFVETSARDDLGVGEDARVEVGNGEWLIDPRNVIIGTGGAAPVPGVNNPPATGTGAYQINRLTLISVLNSGGNVTITTTQPAFADAGNITVSGAVTWTGPNSLTLRADNNITVSAAMGSTGGGSLTLTAGTTNSAGSITTSQTLTAASSGVLTLTAPGAITLGGTVNLSGAARLSATAGTNITVNSAINAAAASSGSVLLDAGNALQLNAAFNLQGSAGFRGVGRGTGISFAGTGNRNFATGTGALTLEAPGANGDIVVGRNANLTGNFLMATGGGAITMTAGRDIRLVSSPFAGGRWTRVGSDTGSAPIGLIAGRNVNWEVGNFTDNFVRVVTAGTLSVTAGQAINLQPSQSAAQLQGLGASFTLTAPTATLNGTVQSRGDTLLQGGNFIFGANSPTFTLDANRSFTLATGSSITSASALSISTSGTGDVTFNGPVLGTTLQAIGGDEVTIGGLIQMSGSGNAIIISAGRRLVNLAGQSLRAPNGRWLTYSVSPFDDIGWQDLNPDAPNLYGRSFGFLPPVSSPGTGNRRIYSFVPVLSLTGDSATKTYGQSGPALGFSVSGLVPGDTLGTALVGGTATVTSAGTAATAGVGVYATTVAAAATAQGYQLNLVAGALTVDPAPLLVTAAPITRQYGLADPVLTFTASGFVNGEDASVLTGALVRDPGENVGVYAIRRDGLAGANYTITFVGANFTIIRAPLSVAADALTREYGLADPALTFTASGFRLGDTAATALTGGLARAPGEAVGSYSIGQGTLAAQNYDISFTGANLGITPAPLDVDALPASKTYGQADPLFAFTAVGFRLGDTAASLTGALSRTPGENVGVYDITLGTLSNPNYAISFGDASFTINPATLQVIANPVTREYGLADPVLTFTLSGLVAGDQPSILTGSLVRAPGENVGVYAIGQNGLSAPNYVIDFTGADFSITPAPLRITPADVTVNAADLPPDPALAFTASGFRRGDSAATALTGALTRDGAGTATPGDFAIRPGTLASTGNYVLSFDSAIFSVTQLALTVIALDQRRLYGAADPVFAFTVTGFRPGDDASLLTGSLTRQAGENVGSYAITQGTLAAPGYVIAFTPGTLVIDPAPLRVTALDFTREYGLADPLPWAFTASGFVLGEDASVLTGALARVAGNNVGTYAIQQGSLSAGNYTIDFTPGTLTITPAPLLVVADDDSRVYGDLDPPVFTFDATGFRQGDGPSILSGALVRDPGNDAGLYAIRQGTLAAGGNYSIQFTNGTFEITRAGLQVTADLLRRLYGDADPQLTFTTSGLVAGDTAATALTGSLLRAPGENVGAYAIGQGNLAARNYIISFAPGALTIDPAPLSVTGLDATREYGLADPRFGFSASGFRLGDTEAVLGGALGRLPGENVGRYQQTLGTLAAGNYVIDFTPGALSITPAPLAVTALPTGRVYGAADPALGFIASGFRLGDSSAVLSGGLVRAVGENVGSYAIGLGTLSAGPNYAINFAGAQFTITPAPLTVTADSLTRLYGDPDPILGFAVAGLVAGDTVSTALTGALARAAGETVGLYAIGQGTLTAQNYDISFVGGTLTITPAPLTVAADAKRRIYGDADPVLTFLASGFRLGDTVASLSGSLVRDPGEDVGAYDIQLGTLANPNYAISFTGATLTIDPALLRVVATPGSKIYGDPDPALGFTATGFRFADTAATVLTGQLSRTPGELVAGSPYAIELGTLAANPNYRIAFESAPFTISRRLLTLLLTGEVARTYNATVTASLSPANLVLGGVLPGDVVAATAASGAFDTPDVGTAKLVTASGVTLTGAAAGNYAVAPTATGAIGTITPAPLVATALDAERPFGVPNPPLRLSLSGLFGSDTAASIGLTAVSDAVPLSAPGPYAINVIGNPRNYSVTRVPGVLTVLPVPVLLQFVPELVEVPALGGYVQGGVGAGVTALSDTLLPGRPQQSETVVEGSRYTVTVQPSPPIGDNPAGSSAFEGAGTLP